MAIIGNKTAESIKNNGELLLTISRERIWDEFKKAWIQSKDFRDYLNYLKYFELYEYIFPGAKINTDIHECHDFVTYIANLFKFDNLKDLERRMVQDYKIESDIASKVYFLINLLNLIPENAFDLYKLKIKSNCEPNIIIDWLDINSITDRKFIRFIDYKPSISAEELMKKGFKGKSLGDEIKRLEIEKFKEMLQ